MGAYSQILGTISKRFKRWRSILSGKIGRMLLVTAGLVLLYRIVLNIPLPGFRAVQSSFPPAGTGAFSLLEFVDMLSGGSLQTASILGLGLLPASLGILLLDILASTVPAVQTWLAGLGAEETGDRRARGRSLLAIPIGLLEALIYVGFLTMSCGGQTTSAAGLTPNADILRKLTLVAMLLGGSFFAMWIADLISKFGIQGQGAAILILSGIAARLPAEVTTIVTRPNSALSLIAYAGVFIVAILAAIYMRSGARNIPIMFPARQRGDRMAPTNGTMPVPFTMGGMSGFMTSQSLVAVAAFGAPMATCSSVPWISQLARGVTSIFAGGSPGFGPVAFFSILFIVPIYSAWLYWQEDYGTSLRRRTAQIPGVQQGAATERFLAGVAERIFITGGLALGLIAIGPWALNMILGLSLSVLIGERIIIAVAAVRDAVMELKTQQILHGYSDSFLVR